MDFSSVVINEYFDLKQIADSGQCFRMKEVLPNVYRIISGDKCVYARQNGNEISFSCSEESFEKDWRLFFDLPKLGHEDIYSQVGKIIDKSDDSYLKDAFSYGKGIRILNQDLWEMIVCFIVSQNNNIKRITTSIDKICNKAALRTQSVDRQDEAFRIPRHGEVCGDFFMDKALGLGYRDIFLKELYDLPFDVEEWLLYLKTLSFEDAYKELVKIKGIGPKVANCICLFGLHHIDAFPIDTHIKQILELHYPFGFDFKRYEGVAGIVQQYMFYYKISK